MTGAAATADLPNVSSPPGRNERQQPLITLSDGDLLELLANAPSRGEGGKPLRRHYAQNLVDVIHWLRRSYYARGPRFRTTWEQGIRGRGDDCERPDRQAVLDHGQRQLKRYLLALEEVGVLAYDGRAGAGGGLFVDLAPPVGSGASARSSAGSSYVSCQLRRRQEPRKRAQERRVRPHRRRKGEEPKFSLSQQEGSAPPRRRLSLAEKLPPSVGVRGPQVPKGTVGAPRTTEQLNAHARAALSIDDRIARLGLTKGSGITAGRVEGGVDPPISPADAIAERIRQRNPQLIAAAEGRVAASQAQRQDARARWLARRQRELESLVPLLVDAQLYPPLATSRAWACFYALFGPSARISRRQRDRLERLLSRMDRVAWGRPAYEGGAGLEALLYVMVDHYDLAERGEAPRPASIAYFLPELSKRCRGWRREARPTNGRASSRPPGRAPDA